MADNALKKYNDKRNFELTQEPPGKLSKKRKTGLLFTVQKHDATRQHYDFRLEWQGVLLSWAVPKGPSYCPKDKRLAVRTEDHPLSYHDFEGIIPAKQYGAGPVMLWDTGVWEPLDKDPEKALAQGKISFRLSGKKLTGEWTLARMNDKQKGRENWLLIKRNDDTAIAKPDTKFLTTTDYSVKTGRVFAEIAANISTAVSDPVNDADELTTLQKKYHSPQLATLVDHPPTGENWVHEVKYDGYRILVFFRNGEVQIRTRNGHDWTDKFPLIAQAFQKLETGTFVLDGEVVVINDKGVSDFKALQEALTRQDVPMQGYFFDLLYWNGEDYSNKKLTQRRQALEQLFKELPTEPLYLSEIVEGDAKEIISKACDLNLEGIISKKSDAKYSQTRNKHWLKSKCQQRQEFIICGFEPASASDKAIGSLHLGFYQQNELLYAGKVGTGFSHQIAFDLYQKLQPLQINKPAFDQKIKGNFKTTNWVKPELLCEVEFATWTRSGKVRHASFQGLRADKKPGQIVKEQPVATAKRSRKAETYEVADIVISNADRQIFPQAQTTKGELASYYEALSEHIMPTLKNRPLSVVRCPGGIDHQCFFQRSKGKGMPKHIHTIAISHNDKSHDYIYLKQLMGLIELVQMGSIEMHPWGAKIDNIEKPDKIVFDLDPDEGIPFEAVKLAAQDVRHRLDDLGLESFVKCTGGKGLHVTVPIQRRQDWDMVKTFARNFAQQMVKAVPQAYTINMAKKQRKGKIFIDYLRNDFASTAVMDYCVRARPGAPVALPLHWDELDSLSSASQFSIEDVLQRQAANKLFVYPSIRQSLTQQMVTEVDDG